MAVIMEAFAVLAAPSSGLHLVDPLPALKHATTVADQACVVHGDTTVGVSRATYCTRLSLMSSQPEWYARRASVAAIYAAAGIYCLYNSFKNAFLIHVYRTSSDGLSRDRVHVLGRLAQDVFYCEELRR